MRGRKPKPHAIRAAQGNPGNRPLPADASADGQSAESAPLPLPFVKLTDSGRMAYDIIGTQLRTLNFVRATDEPLLIRYAQTLARYWHVTNLLDRKGTIQRVKTVAGGVMERLRPQFVEQERLFHRLESMEDRLGLSPVARQQYLLRMAASGATPNYPQQPGKTVPQPDDSASPGLPLPPPAAPRSPIGLLRSPTDSVN